MDTTIAVEIITGSLQCPDASEKKKNEINKLTGTALIDSLETTSKLESVHNINSVNDMYITPIPIRIHIPINATTCTLVLPTEECKTRCFPAENSKTKRKKIVSESSSLDDKSTASNTILMPSEVPKRQMSYTPGLVLALAQQVDLLKPFGICSAKKWVIIAENLAPFMEKDTTTSIPIIHNNVLALAHITREAKEAIANKNSSYTNPLTAAFKKYYKAWIAGANTKLVTMDITGNVSADLSTVMQRIEDFKATLKHDTASTVEALPLLGPTFTSTFAKS